MRIIISNLSASRVNLLQNDYAAGIPSPTAFMGLGSTILHELGFDRWSVRVLPILHEVHVSPGRTKPAQVAEGRRFSNVEIPEDMIGTVRFSMIMDLPEPRDVPDILQTLPGKRLAGGVIFPQRRGEPLRVEEVPNDGHCLYSSRRGRALIPGLRESMSGAFTFGEDGGFTKVRDALCVLSTEEEPSPGYRVPVAIGYRLLTQPGDHPVPRAARDPDIPHVYGEPGVGVAELVSVRNPDLTGLSAAEMAKLFWFWSVRPSHITAHSIYNPEEDN